MAETITQEELARREAEWRAEALAAFPYERIQISGANALQEWEWLRRTASVAPVVVGGDEALDRILEPFHPDPRGRSDESWLVQTLAKADQLTHPKSLMAHREAEGERLRQWCEENADYCAAFQVFEENLGESSVSPDYFPHDTAPAEEEPSHQVPPLTVALDWRTGQPFESVWLVLVPTDDWTTIPAHLRWGHWNANPPPEIHVAALRSWRDRYGAELVGLSGDTMNIRVASKPASPDEAMALAGELYVYCNDIVDQGVGTVANLAAMLQSEDWWFFWWD